MSDIYMVFGSIKQLAQEEENEQRRLLGIWEVNDSAIRNVYSDYDSHELRQGEDLRGFILRTNRYNSFLSGLEEGEGAELQCVKINQQRRIYFPRIYRPVYGNFGASTAFYIGEERPAPVDTELLRNTLMQITSYVELLNTIFQSVFPTEENFEVYGFNIRNLILLACTEFESQARGILIANNLKHRGNFYTTKDYVKLKSVLKLEDYAVRFTHFPNIPVLEPFRKWDENDPTVSLKWYDNYNSTKHNREVNFSKGRLIDLLNALSANYIMLIAQFGELEIINDMLRKYWTIEKKPQWSIDEMLYRPVRDEAWKMKWFF